MGIIATIQDGRDARRAYVRLISFEQLANHGVPAVAVFRAFTSKEAFEQGDKFIEQREVTFNADISQPLWPQAYDAAKRETVQAATGEMDGEDPVYGEVPWLADVEDAL